jgi:hypothetical protein
MTSRSNSHKRERKYSMKRKYLYVVLSKQNNSGTLYHTPSFVSDMTSKHEELFESSRKHRSYCHPKTSAVESEQDCVLMVGDMYGCNNPCNRLWIFSSNCCCVSKMLVTTVQTQILCFTSLIKSLASLSTALHFMSKR